MEIEEAKGLAIFVGVLTFYGFFLFACMERRLENLDRLFRKIENK